MNKFFKAFILLCIMLGVNGCSGADKTNDVNDAEKLKKKAQSVVSLFNNDIALSDESIEESESGYIFSTVLKGKANIMVQLFFDKQNDINGFTLQANDLDANNLAEAAQVIDDGWLALVVDDGIHLTEDERLKLCMFPISEKASINETYKNDELMASFMYSTPFYHSVNDKTDTYGLKKPFNNYDKAYNDKGDLISTGSILATVINTKD